ncbi:MAG TPA: hypothetical protein VHF46_07330 [Rubrobacteraceae bacterium]|nr:hypothetical protein [Rubrobacteraceae bacterium]
MRILILGGDGMLGHRLLIHLQQEHDVRMTLRRDLSGVWQVASAPINKYDLLVRFSEVLGRRDIKIIPDDVVKIDRSLVPIAFEKATGYSAPGWDEMLEELGAEVRKRQTPGAEREKVW